MTSPLWVKSTSGTAETSTSAPVSRNRRGAGEQGGQPAGEGSDGTSRAEAWHRVHPLIHGDRGWFAGRKSLPGPARHPHPHHRRAAPRRPRPAPRHVAVARRPRPAVPRRALARLPRQVRHRARLQASQGQPRPHRRQSPPPRSGRRLGPAPHGRARPAPARQAPGRRPPPPVGETSRSRPAAHRRPGPPRVSQHPPHLGTPARVAKPSRPRVGRPKGSGNGPARRYLFPGEADMPRVLTNESATSPAAPSVWSWIARIAAMP